MLQCGYNLMPAFMWRAKLIDDIAVLGVKKSLVSEQTERRLFAVWKALLLD